jgi:hypothetical protein
MISRSPRNDQPMPPLRGAGCITVSFRPAIPRRPGRTSLTRGNVGGSHTPGTRTAETALAGALVSMSAAASVSSLIAKSKFPVSSEKFPCSEA